MTGRRIGLVALVVALGAGFSLTWALVGHQSSAPARPVAGPSLGVTPAVVPLGHGPVPIPPGEQLRRLQFISSDDIWASVLRINPDHTMDLLLKHWNGRVWHIVPNPDPHEDQSFYVVAPDDIWLYGQGFSHWDGRSWWPVSGAAGVKPMGIYAMSGSGPSDLWAVGQQDSGASHGHVLQTTLVEHWDGTTWTAYSTPNAVPYLNTLEGVMEVAPDDVWAVGSAITLATQNPYKAGHDDPLALHWDGTTWKIVPPPRFPGATTSFLQSVARAPASGSVWVVGSGGNDQTGHPYVARWTGDAWTILPLPPGPMVHTISGFVATSSSEGWAVGESGDADDGPTWVGRWTGSAWDVLRSPLTGSLWSFRVGPSGDVWIVSYLTNAFKERRLGMARWDGRTWKTYALPSPINGLH